MAKIFKISENIYLAKQMRLQRREVFSKEEGKSGECGRFEAK